MTRLAFLFFLFTGWMLTARGESLAFGDGEMFKFRVGWGIFPSAGEITVSAHNQTEENLPQLHVMTTTSTRGLLRQFYLFDGDAESFFDAEDGKLLAAKANSTGGKKHTKSMAVFDYTKKEVRYVDYVNADRNKTIALPSGNPVDLITSLILTRNWAMKPGEKRPAVVMFDDEFYDLTIVAERYDRVHTPWGTVETLVYAPIMEKDPKGMFKKGGQVRVWISQDDRHLPVKFEVVLKFGTATASLTDYHPPTTAHAGVTDANPHP